MKKIILQNIDKMNYQTKESYKTLRTNLQFCGSDVKTILFTSCTQNEGKSSITFNVAASLANTDKKVVFVDADLRKSVLIGRHKIQTPILGLSHYLSGQCALNDTLYSTNIEHLDVILCSKYPPNPTELVGHENFQIMIAMLRETYDYVIIDSPPLGMVIDSAIMATACDGAVIVIECNKTSKKYVLNVKKQLEKSGCKVLGAVLNKVPMTKKHYYGKYDKYYGQYYDTYQNKKYR